MLAIKPECLLDDGILVVKDEQLVATKGASVRIELSRWQAGRGIILGLLNLRPLTFTLKTN